MLSRILNRSCSEVFLKVIHVSKGGTELIHALFADDLIIFARANKKVAMEIKKCLKLYCSWPSQKVNASKSAIYSSKNLERATSIEVNGMLAYDQLRERCLHLGPPLFIGRNRTRDWSFLVEKTELRVAGWKQKLLSKAGRMILIKTAAQASPSYSMATNVLPKSICRRLDGTFRRCSWGTTANGSQRMCLLQV